MKRRYRVEITYAYIVEADDDECAVDEALSQAFESRPKPEIEVRELAEYLQPSGN